MITEDTGIAILPGGTLLDYELMRAIVGARAAKGGTLTLSETLDVIDQAREQKHQDNACAVGSS